MVKYVKILVGLLVCMILISCRESTVHKTPMENEPEFETQVINRTIEYVTDSDSILHNETVVENISYSYPVISNEDGSSYIDKINERNKFLGEYFLYRNMADVGYWNEEDDKWNTIPWEINLSIDVELGDDGEVTVIDNYYSDTDTEEPYTYTHRRTYKINKTDTSGQEFIGYAAEIRSMLVEAGWENISVKDGVYDIEWGNSMPIWNIIDENDINETAYTVYGSIEGMRGNCIGIFVEVGIEENDTEKIRRVWYTSDSGRDEVSNDCEIVKAYDIDLWDYMYSY